MRWLLVALLTLSKFVHAQLPRAAPIGPHRFASLAGFQIEFLEGDLALGEQFGDVLAANLSGGIVLWRAESAKAIGLHGGLAVLSVGKKLVVRALADGKSAWTYKHDREVSTGIVDGRPPALVDDELVIVADGLDRKGDLEAFDVKTGKRKWVVEADSFGLLAWRGGLLTSLDRNPVAYLPAGVPGPAPSSICARELWASEIGIGGERDVIPARLARAGFPPSRQTPVAERERTEIFYEARCKVDALAIAKVLGVPETAMWLRKQVTEFGVTIAMGVSRSDAGVK